MSATQKDKPSNWSKIMKQQIKGINKAIVDLSDGEDIPIVVRPPEPVSIFKKRKESSLDLYLNRKRFNNVQKTINLVQESRPSTKSDSIQILDTGVSVKPANPASLKKKTEDDQVVVTDVINLEQKTSKDDNIEKYKRKMFGNSYKPMKLSMPVPNRNPDNQLKRQLQTIEQMNKPEWVRQKEERRAINKQKYPNSYTHSYDFSSNDKFTGFGAYSDKQHQLYLQKREQDKLKNKQKREAQKIKKKKEQQQREKKQLEERNAEQEYILKNLVPFQPKKKVKQNECLNDAELAYEKDKEEGQLVNKQALQVVAQEQPNTKQVVEIIIKRQKRVGAKDTIKYQSTAPNLINMILKHNYGEQISKLQTKKLPDIFPDLSTYQKMFHYMISNQSIADISHKLRTIQKGSEEPLKIVINDIKTNHDGEVELALTQKETTYNSGIELKNHSFSRNRIGLICSSKEYCKQYYGVPGKNKKQFGFLVMLITPTNHDEVNKEVRVSARIKSSNLEDLLHFRKTKQAYFFDLDKLSTILREYLAVSNVVCSELYNSVLDPSQVEKEVGNFIEKQEELDNILNYLKQIYNETQWQSIREMVLRERGFVLLQGPPGTGKTSTLMGLLSAQYELLKKTGDNRKIMICAPSNAAVDHITKRIMNQGLMTGQAVCVRPRILRTGIVETLDEKVRSVSLDEQCEKIMIEQMEQAQKMKQMSTAQIKQKIISLQKEMRRLDAKYRDVEVAAKKQQLTSYQKMLFEFKSTKHITSKAKYNAIEDSLLRSAEIVLTTLSSSGNDKIDKIRGEIACLIVDEAAQATEPNLLIALQTGVQKVILIGDPYQLPATVISPDANVTLFNRSLFERFLDANIKPYFLNIQYRMSPIIREFPSSRFYHDRLIDGETVLMRPIPLFLKNFEGRNVIFIDLKYGSDERKGDSFCNYAQVKVISLIIRCLIDASLTLGLITPYQAQKRAIYRDCMNSLKESQTDQLCFQKQVMINTVDSFQGQEKDIIIVSTVRANPSYNVGFLTDQRRINVTLTRAKHLMIVIGNADTLGSNQVWDDFLSWTQARKCYYQISSERKMQDIIGNMFEKVYQPRIRRIKHSQLSTDVRNLHRNQIQSKDFKQKKQPSVFNKKHQIQKEEKLFTKSNNQKQLQNQEIAKKQKKYAMHIQESQQILKDKKKKQDQNKQFINMLQRMKKLQEENYQERFY